MGRLRWAVPAGKEAYAAAAHVGSPETRTISLGGEGKRGVPASLASLQRLHLCVNTSDDPRVLSSFPLLLSPSLAHVCGLSDISVAPFSRILRCAASLSPQGCKPQHSPSR